MIFKNAVHSLKPGETPSYSASHQAPNYVQLSLISQNILKQFNVVTVRLPFFFQYTYVQYFKEDVRQYFWLKWTLWVDHSLALFQKDFYSKTCNKQPLYSLQYSCLKQVWLRKANIVWRKTMKTEWITCVIKYIWDMIKVMALPFCACASEDAWRRRYVWWSAGSRTHSGSGQSHAPGYSPGNTSQSSGLKHT